MAREPFLPDGFCTGFTYAVRRQHFAVWGTDRGRRRSFSGQSFAWYQHSADGSFNNRGLMTKLAGDELLFEYDPAVRGPPNLTRAAG
jgi:hypothetical protein